METECFVHEVSDVHLPTPPLPTLTLTHGKGSKVSKVGNTTVPPTYVEGPGSKEVNLPTYEDIKGSKVSGSKVRGKDSSKVSHTTLPPTYAEGPGSKVSNTITFPQSVSASYCQADILDNPLDPMSERSNSQCTCMALTFLADHNEGMF